MGTLALATWLFAGGVGLTRRAAGQDAGDELRDEEARQLFEAGRLAFTAGRFESALHSFERAHELSDRALLLYNIGTCYDRLRRDRQALETFRRYLAEVPDAANRAEVEARVAVLEDAIGEGGATPAPDVGPVAVEPEPSPALNLAVTPDAQPRDDDGGVLETWWFWTIVGAVVAGGVIATVLVATAGDSTEEPLLGSTGVVSRAIR